MVDPFKVFWVLTNSTYLVTKFIRTGVADSRNDSPIYFEKTFYEAEVNENADINHTVLRIATKNYQDSATIRYEITSGNIGNAFEVENATGAIYVAGVLDYEARKRYELRIAASNQRKENFTTVVIHVKDVNDNPPVFEKSTYKIQITEEDSRNLPKNILKVTATDADKDRPQNIVYFLTGQGIDPDNPANSKFDINKATGEVIVLKPLDRDPPNGKPHWRFTVFAQDEGGDGLVGYADVQINLKDVNDNAPLFLQSVYFGNVTENGTTGMPVMTVTAVDYDDLSEGTNAHITYSIEKNVIEEETGLPIFEIDPHTGLIKTAVCCLDRERTPDYSIQIIATDGGGLKGTGTASIRVKDINDMPPRFTRDEWFAEVDETNGSTLPDAPILTVTVQDDDEINDFRYQVVPNSGYGSNKFRMVANSDGTGSLKVARPLDFEDELQRKGLRFKIQVSDGSDGINHVAYAWVVIKLRDINDNAPKLEKSEIKLFVLENIEIGKSLTVLRATDLDRAGKSVVYYEIERSSDQKRQFSVDQYGTVIVQQPLDREENPLHELQILAIDDGLPPKTSTATVTVVVEDINDNAPVFAEDYRPVIQEHTTPQQIAEILAIDYDDNTKGNGGPFRFRLDENVSDLIKASFRVEEKRKNTRSDTVAVISSIRSFDREQQKEYYVPIVITDHGNPAMSGTSTLTVIVGDVNDNQMQSDSKEILVYNYQGQAPESEIGRVYVRDLDDWDIPDKSFYWSNMEHPKFKLNSESGMISMRRGTQQGVYNLEFKVCDKKHNQNDIHALVKVTVRNIPYEAVLNSGSIRIAGLRDEDFIRVWHYQTEKISKSIYEKFCDILADVLKVTRHEVDVFSVFNRQKKPPNIDVRFSVRNGHSYMKPVKLNAFVMMHREEIEKACGIDIIMVGINECLQENQYCAGSCTNKVDVNGTPFLVNANKTALVGVSITTRPDCTCTAKNFTKKETCRNMACYNNGKCIQMRSSVSCSCPVGFNGPRCQQTSRSFHGNGVAWFPALETCDNSHLHFEFVTRKPEGLFIYNGPIVAPKDAASVVSDFISVELVRGYPRLLLDFGSGTTELKIKTRKTLNDGEWHRLDVFWDRRSVRMVVDRCIEADVVELEDGSFEFEDINCQAQETLPGFNEFLNLNVPLQLGGFYVKKFDLKKYNWRYIPSGTPFDGCIRNLAYNSHVYDLGDVGFSINSASGCPQTQQLCDNSLKCGESGKCDASMNVARCECFPGWTGLTCATRTSPIYLNTNSYIKYALSFEPDRFSTQIQLRFRTRETTGELFRLSDQNTRTYAILEINKSKINLRCNLNSQQPEENIISLNEVSVNDGEWHVVKFERYGSALSLYLDGGEGRRYNDSFEFSGYQWLQVDKQEGVYVGGKAEFTTANDFQVPSDFNRGCLDDVRLNGKSLPLPPIVNGTQWGQVTIANGVEEGCNSNKSCSGDICPSSFICVDLWNDYECVCKEGKTASLDGTECVDKNECLDHPCLYGGTCVNLESKYRYRCYCTEGYWGKNCELLNGEWAITMSIEALATIASCFVTVLIILAVLVINNKRKKLNPKIQKPDDDFRENVVTYDEEGGGEDDMTAFDISPLQIPINEAQEALDKNVELELNAMISESKTESALHGCKNKADNDITTPPFDDLRNYTYEGGDTSRGSLTSIASGTDEEHLDFTFLNNWGSHFANIANMYRQS